MIRLKANRMFVFLFFFFAAAFDGTQAGSSPRPALRVVAPRIASPDLSEGAAKLPSRLRPRVPINKALLYIVDGDTIYYGAKGTEKVKFRIAGIDTPEIKHYGAGKFNDQEYGQEALKQARRIFHSAEKVEALIVGIDKYQRTLAHIFVDDKLYAVEIIKKGLAYEYITRHGDNGTPDLAEEILEAARKYPRLPFEYPHDWREREWSPAKEAQELKWDLGLKKKVMDKSKIEFDDGDTIFYKGKPIRFLGMDTPEIIHETDGIFENQPYGPEAAAYTKNLILKASKVEYLPGPKDRYGRQMAHIFLDGEHLGILIIKAGLAYQNVSVFGPSGYPGFARMILAAFREMPNPPFENPLYWRGKHQHRPEPGRIIGEVVYDDLPDFKFFDEIEENAFIEFTDPDTLETYLNP